MKWFIVFLLILVTSKSYAPGLSIETKEAMQQAEEKARLEEDFRIYQERLLKAIIRYESAGDSTAHNIPEDACGVLQIRKCYVREVNNICIEVYGITYKKFNYEDRWDRDKSIEMYTILNDYHNPGYHLDTTSHIHNAGAYSVKKRWKLTKGYREVINNYFDENKEVMSDYFNKNV